MRKEEAIFWSAIALMSGCLILIFSATLRNKYRYSSTFQDPIHLHIAVSIFFIVGAIIAVLGLIGIIIALFKQ